MTFTVTNFPEPGDTEDRCLLKIVETLFTITGNKGPTYFPEGSAPRAGDTTEHMLQKINAMLSGT